MTDKAKHNDVRAKIIDVSRELFTRKGFRETTVRDIAAAAGITPAMVNYYFQSKHKLFETIFEESFDILISKVLSAIDSGLPFFEMIREWVYSYYEVMKELPHLPAFILTEISRNPELFGERFRLRDTYQMYAKLAIRINEEQTRGVIRKDMTVSDFLLNIASLSVFPFIFSPVATSLLNLGQKEYEEMLDKHKESVAAFIISGIKAQ